MEATTTQNPLHHVVGKTPTHVVEVKVRSPAPVVSANAAMTEHQSSSGTAHASLATPFMEPAQEASACGSGSGS
eukprot:11374163-Karenia_brevis.AAC.1